MKNSNYISESVYRVNVKYNQLQNKTKELFFKYLDEGRDTEEFKEALEKIWGNIDYSYFQDELDEYAEIIHEYNTHGKEIIREIPKGEEGILFALVPIAVLKRIDNKFARIKEREYKRSYESPAYKNDKKQYLDLKQKRYTDNMISYYSKKTGEIIRQVSPAVYNSMVHNTNLTREEWNTTLNDADMIGARGFWIPFHPFSCEYCLSHQNRYLTKNEVINIAGVAEEAEGDILHPNCKCSLTIYDDNTKFNRPKYNEAELNEQYHIRQKVNSLTLQKERVKTDMKIAEQRGSMEEFDKYNQQRNKINKEIRELKEELPTESLRKQVVAINR